MYIIYKVISKLTLGAMDELLYIYSYIISDTPKILHSYERYPEYSIEL